MDDERGPLWTDNGPASQGKIITAILQGRRSDAEQFLHRWAVNDLVMLARAADILKQLCLEEQVRQRRRARLRSVSVVTDLHRYRVW
jgi:hypothetical protein